MTDTDQHSTGICRVLTRDGGGAKGFYTLGVLREIEGMTGRPLCESFDLIYGTSTGAIIGSLLALGKRIDEVYDLYKQYVPPIMAKRTASGRTSALESASEKVFGDSQFADSRTGIGIVATKWIQERPMIFKGGANQAHGRKGTFVPGFGVRMAEAVQASCSAYPFFHRKTVVTSAGDRMELVDGGYCANNPTLYAIADATRALQFANGDIRVVNVGVGVYPEPKPSPLMWLARRYIVSVHLLQKTLESNTQSMDQLRSILFHDIPTLRISDVFERPEMATDLLEHDMTKLNLLHVRGRESFATREKAIRQYLLS
jgi:predicted acylesterase/phospholipase RssA